MNAATAHIAMDDLARFALAARPHTKVFDGTRAHLAGGCSICSMQLAVFAGDPAPAVRPAGWIVPKRVRRAAVTRAGVLADHELVCGAGDYELDVIVREMESPQRLDIGGQLTRAKALHDPARDVPLFLVEATRESGVVGATRTDEFGEFDFAASRGRGYGLRVGDHAGAPCVLVWDGAS